MQRSNNTEQQIAFALQQAVGGTLAPGRSIQCEPPYNTNNTSEFKPCK